MDMLWTFNFQLMKTYQELFKLDTRQLIKNIIEISKSGKDYPVDGAKFTCIISIDGVDFLAMVYNLDLAMYFSVTEVNKIVDKNISSIVINSSLCFELDMSCLIEDALNNPKPEDDSNKINSLYALYKFDKFGVLGQFTPSLNDNFYVKYDIDFIKKVFDAINIDSSWFIGVIEDEFKSKSELVKKELICIFDNIPDFFVKDELYYYGDADYSVVLLEKSENKTVIGYNNVVSCDEYFILMEKHGNDFIVKFESFANLEKMKGYKKLKRLNAFEEGKNTKLVNKLEPVYKTSADEYYLDSYYITVWGFAISCVNRAIRNQKPV